MFLCSVRNTCDVGRPLEKFVIHSPMANICSQCVNASITCGIETSFLLITDVIQPVRNEQSNNYIVQ
jgi:hypothetical protein